MSDIQRGSTKHGPELDEEMKQESRGMVLGHPGRPHAEPFRETEPLPDDTDADEVERAFERDEPEVAHDDTGSAGAAVGNTDGGADVGSSGAGAAHDERDEPADDAEGEAS